MIWILLPDHTCVLTPVMKEFIVEVYRVHSRDDFNRGPYRYCHPLIDKHCDDRSRWPPIYEDYDEKPDLRVKIWYNKPYPVSFCFTTLEQFLEWFGEDLEVLHEYDQVLSIIEVPEIEVVRGLKQAFFYQNTHTKIVETLELTELYSLV